MGVQNKQHLSLRFIVPFSVPVGIASTGTKSLIDDLLSSATYNKVFIEELPFVPMIIRSIVMMSCVGRDNC